MFVLSESEAKPLSLKTTRVISDSLLNSTIVSVMFLVILQPILNVKNNSLDLFENVSISDSKVVQVQDEYLDLVMNNKNQKNQELCKKILDNYGVKYKNLEIIYSSINAEYKIENITLDLDEYYLMIEHKDIIESAKKDITTALKIKMDKIIINE